MAATGPRQAWVNTKTDVRVRWDADGIELILVTKIREEIVHVRGGNSFGTSLFNPYAALRDAVLVRHERLQGNGIGRRRPRLAEGVKFR